MTEEQRRQAAAQRCADLAQTAGKHQNEPAFFRDDIGTPTSVAFRHYVEHIDARDRGFLVSLEGVKEFLHDNGLHDGHLAVVMDKLRADLLPDPVPSPVERLAKSVQLDAVGMALRLSELGLELVERKS